MTDREKEIEFLKKIIENPEHQSFLSWLEEVIDCKAIWGYLLGAPSEAFVKEIADKAYSVAETLDILIEGFKFFGVFGTINANSLAYKSLYPRELGFLLFFNYPKRVRDYLEEFHRLSEKVWNLGNLALKLEVSFGRFSCATDTAGLEFAARHPWLFYSTPEELEGMLKRVERICIRKLLNAR